MAFQTTSYGNAECVREPMGEHGLEGYALGDQYCYHRLLLVSGTNRVAVWGCELAINAACTPTVPPWIPPDIMTPGTFAKFFQVREEKDFRPGTRPVPPETA